MSNLQITSTVSIVNYAVQGAPYITGSSRFKNVSYNLRGLGTRLEVTMTDDDVMFALNRASRTACLAG